MAAVVVYLKARLSSLGLLLTLTGFVCIGSLGVIMWLPTLLIREHGMTASEAGYIVGIVGTPSTLAGNFFWAWVASTLHKRDPRRGMVRALLVPAIFAPLCYAAGLYMGTVPMALAALGGGLFMSSAFQVLSPLAIQSFVPAGMRARFISINYLIISALGYTLGPLLVVEIGAWVAGVGHGLRSGMIATCLLSWPLLVLATVTVARNANGLTDD